MNKNFNNHKLDKKKQVEINCKIAWQYIERSYQDNKKELIYAALDLFTESIKLEPNAVKAYIGIAYLEYYWGNITKAHAILDKAVKLDILDTSAAEIIKFIKNEVKKRSKKKVLNPNLENKLPKNRRENPELIKKAKQQKKIESNNQPNSFNFDLTSSKRKAKYQENLDSNDNYKTNKFNFSQSKSNVFFVEEKF